VLVSPSLYEVFGLTLLEAMACGCPVIALRRSAVPEVVGDAALLLDDPDETALAAALVRVLRERDVAADLRARGLVRAAAFSWERAAEATEAVYAEALARRRLVNE
jgi:glycosyltransferase involved in cell wall biosynthesis